MKCIYDEKESIWIMLKHPSFNSLTQQDRFIAIGAQARKQLTHPSLSSNLQSQINGNSTVKWMYLYALRELSFRMTLFQASTLLPLS